MKRFACWVAVVATLALTGCAHDEGDKSAGTAAKSATASYSAGGLTLDKRPEKIVSLSPSATEMLFAIGAGPQVTAADNNSNYPAGAPKTDLSGFQPNAEAIAAKQPDLVVISNDINKIKDQLGALKIPVYVAAAATTLDDTYRQVTELGALTGHADGASALGTQMKDDIAKLVAGAPRPKKAVTYYYELDPTLFTVTSKTYAGSLFALFGMQNIADPADADGKKGGYPQLTPEALISANPDFVFLADTKCCKQTAATVAARPGWAGVTAVKSGNVVGLDDDVASRWGPRVVDLVRAIADAVK
jgi:iron complex transport system substrate-binding protein